jgi:hypothetical protein
MNSIVKLAAKFTEHLNQLNEKNDTKQDEIQNTKAKLGEVLKKKWRNKVMQGQYIWNVDGQLISEEDTLHWVMEGDKQQKLKVK